MASPGRPIVERSDHGALFPVPWLGMCDYLKKEQKPREPLHLSPVTTAMALSPSLFLLQMNMLMRLKEAATYSSAQSCDSDTAGQHEDILDPSLESTL